MRKLKTLFIKDPNDLSKVLNEIDPDCKWVYEFGLPTRKFDGSACAVFEGILYKRYDSKINKKTGKRKPVPDNAIPCQEPDEITGHWPHWIKCERDKPEDKYFFEAFDCLSEVIDGTYELCGEKVQSNPEKIEGHKLLKHGSEILDLLDFSYDNIREYFSKKENDIEGIVFHNKNNNEMCKIRKSDFGLPR